MRVGTGFSFSDYVWIRAKPWKDWDPKAPPPWLQVSGKGMEDKGDVYLEPEEYDYISITFERSTYTSCSSFILKVKAAEIVNSGLCYLTLFKWEGINIYGMGMK